MINTVGELRAALSSLPDDVIVQISYMPEDGNIYYSISIDSMRFHDSPDIIKMYEKEGVKTSGFVSIQGVPPEFPKDENGMELY